MRRKAYTYRRKRSFKRRRGRYSRVTRALKRTWYSAPARFTRRLVGRLITTTVMTGLRIGWWTARKMARHY
jgi:hypothetical protein